jgi:hypothetical protein
MADWTDDATLIASLAAGKAFTDEKAQALAENSIAIAEGAMGAPRVEGRALNTHLGELTITTTPSGFIDLDRFETIFIAFLGSNSGSVSALEARYSNNSGGSWGSYQFIGNSQSLIVGSESFRMPGHIRVNLRTGEFVFYHSPGSGRSVGTHTVPSSCNSFQLRVNLGTVYGDVYCLGGLTA